jgi:hypothetical protein
VGTRETSARGLPINGCRPKFVARLASVGAVGMQPEEARQHAANGALPAAFRSDEEKDFLLPGIAAEDVAEDFLEHVDGRRSRARDRRETSTSDPAAAPEHQRQTAAHSD